MRLTDGFRRLEDEHDESLAAKDEEDAVNVQISSKSIDDLL